MDTIKELFKQGIATVFAAAAFIFLLGSFFEIKNLPSFSISPLKTVYWPPMAVGIPVLVIAIFIWYKDKYSARNLPNTSLGDDSLLSCLYTIYGVEKGVNNLRFDAVYQDFNTSRYGIINRNTVHFLWADTCKGNSINAEIIKNTDEGHFLRVTFNDNPDSWLSNIAIAPNCKKALGNYDPATDGILKHKCLKITCRVPQDSSSRISITLRVVDKNLTYWEYKDSHEYKQLPVDSNSWQDIYADLGATEFWKVFPVDGNHYIDNPPDFSVMAGVVLIFGFFSDIDNSSPGHGVVDVKKIWLG